MKKYDNYIKFLEINLLILPHRDINRLSQWQGAIASNNFQKFVLIFVEKKRDKISLPTLSICLNDQFLASSIRFGKAKSTHLKDSINKIGFRHRESNPGLLGESQLSWPLDHAGLINPCFQSTNFDFFSVLSAWRKHYILRDGKNFLNINNGFRLSESILLYHYS